MNIFIHFAYPKLLIVGFLVFFLVLIYRWRWFRPVAYQYSLVKTFAVHGMTASQWHKQIFFFMRSLLLTTLVLLIGRPQLTDTRLSTSIEGIDIVLALDVSESMTLFDDQKDQRPRIEVAKEEARRFICKRENDSFALVLFANEAISRAPLTMDKKLLSQLIDEVEIGIIDHRATVLSTALALSVHRLKHSKAKTKIIILLTDGCPTGNDIDPEVAIKLAQDHGIKIYTIGIGNENGGYFHHPLGLMQESGSALNGKLLKHIADATGGRFFEAKKPEDMKFIYHEIDRLEKTKHDIELYYNYHEFFLQFLIFAIILVFCEIIFSVILVGL